MSTTQDHLDYSIDPFPRNNTPKRLLIIKTRIDPPSPLRNEHQQMERLIKELESVAGVTKAAFSDFQVWLNTPSEEAAMQAVVPVAKVLAAYL